MAKNDNMNIDNLPKITLLMMVSGLFITGMSYQNLQSNPLVGPIGLFLGGVMFGLSTSFADY